MASIDKRGGKWRTRYRDPGGKSRSKSFSRVAEARAFLASVEAAKARGVYQDPAFGRQTLEAFWTGWLAQAEELGRPQASTLAKYQAVWRRYVNPALGSYPLAEIRRADIQHLVTSTTRRSSAYQGAEALKLVRMLLNRALDAELIAVNRAARVQPPKIERKRPRVLTPEEIDRLAEAVGESWGALVRLAAYGALRWSEVAGLRVQDIDFLRRQIRVEQKIVEVRGKFVQGAPKTEASRRTVPMPASVIEDLAAHLNRHPASPEGLVFHGRTGGPIRRMHFYRDVWKPALRATGLTGFRVLNLRHTGATLVLEAGGSLKDVADRLGHTSTRMADELYVELSDGRGRAIADQLDAYARPQRREVEGIGGS